MSVGFDVKVAISSFDKAVSDVASDGEAADKLAELRIRLIKGVEGVVSKTKKEFRSRYFTFLNTPGRSQKEIEDLNSVIEKIRPQGEFPLEIVCDRLSQFHQGRLSFKEYESLLVKKPVLLEKAQKWLQSGKYAKLHETFACNSILDIRMIAMEYSSALDILSGRGDSPLKKLDLAQVRREKVECKKALKECSVDDVESLMAELNVSSYVSDKVKAWAQKNNAMRD